MQFSGNSESIAPEIKYGSVKLEVANAQNDLHPRFTLPLLATTQKIPNGSLCTGTADTCSNLNVATVNIGDVAIGQTGSQTFWVKNVGQGQLNIVNSCLLNALSSCSVPPNQNGPFTFETVDDVAISPGANQSFTVSFSPSGSLSSPLPLQILLQVETNDPNQPLLTVTVNARAIAPAAALQWESGFDGNFGEALAHGKSAISRTLTLTNNGVGPLDVGSLDLEGDPSFTFSSSAWGELAQGESLDVAVLYAPVSDGNHTADLVFRLGAGLAEETVTLTGTGVYAAVSAENTAWLDVTFVGENSSWSMELTNVSAVALPIASLEVIEDFSGSFALENDHAETSLDVGGTLSVPILFSPQSDATEPTGLNAAVRVNLDVESTYDEAFPSVVVEAQTQTKPAAALHAIETDGSTGTLLTDDPENTVTLNFGDVVVGQEKEISLRLLNSDVEGTGRLELLENCFKATECLDPKNSDGYFTVSPAGEALPGALVAGEQLDYRFTFSPTAQITETETHETVFEVQTNDPHATTITVQISARVIDPQPMLAWATNSDFGKVLVQRLEAETRVLEIHNDGAGPLILSHLELSGSTSFFSNDALAGVSVGPGEQHNVTVAFLPDAGGEASANVVVHYASTLEASEALSVTGEGVWPSLSPALLSFDDTYYDQPNNQIFAITNNGEVPVSIEDVTIIDDASGSFSINNLSSITNAGPLEPEQSLNVSLTFQPKASEVAWQELTAKLKFTLEVQEEYPDAAQPVIELMGRTQQRPEVTVSILSHDFGDVLLGESVTQDLQITNVGLGRLELPQTCFVDNNSTCLNTPTSSGAYSWTGTLPSHLGPGEATSLSVTYSPSEAAAGAPQETATLLIETNDGANPNVPNDIDEQALEVTLTARAVNPDSALSMEAFPLTLVYSTTWVYRNLTITNEGTGTLTVSDITVDDPSVGAGEDNEFTVDLPSVLTIAEGSDLTVPIGFRPTGSGERAATLVISFDGLPDKTRAINGQGVYGALAPTTHVFPKTWVGDSSDATLTLVNSTGVALPISSVALAGAHESNYAIVDVAYETGNTADGVLDNGKSLLVDLRFEPKEASIAGSTEVTLNLAELQVTLNVADAYPGANNPLITDLSGAAQKKPSLAIYEADGSTVLLASGTSSAQADLGNVVVGQTGSFTFRVKNEGAGQLELPTACFSQAGCNVPNHEDGSFSFSPSAQGTPAFPDALEPGGYVDVTVSFSPTETVASPVTQTATWALQTNDPDATEQKLNWYSLVPSSTHNPPWRGPTLKQIGLSAKRCIESAAHPKQQRRAAANLRRDP